MQVLAIVSRRGKFLPLCLTCGPTNGPDEKCLDQRILTDVEYDEEIRLAATKAGVQVAQKSGEALRFSKRGLGHKSKPGIGEKGKQDPVVADHNHPLG